MLMDASWPSKREVAVTTRIVRSSARGSVSMGLPARQNCGLAKRAVEDVDEPADEEVAAEHNGLRELFAQRPDLLAADVAVLGEPTSGQIEAGCQGTMRLRVTLGGARAHTARAWMGTNAIHRLGPLLDALAAYVPREPVLEGCRFHEGLVAVDVVGGVAGNVVPDEASVVINHRYAPDRSPAQAEAHVREFLAPLLGKYDSVEVTDNASAARPGMDHALLASLASAGGLEVNAKLGWTDVAFFSEQGIPAINFGPGDALIAHTSDEFVTGERLQHCYDALTAMLTG
ncbi:MAG: succinyl-diaminopimelate desuccinylase [Acidobacteria bacterium]|nr:succinyl-diaminopimelate desuccinylase [Acidobacteriota bacterium]